MELMHEMHQIKLWVMGLVTAGLIGFGGILWTAWVVVDGKVETVEANVIELARVITVAGEVIKDSTASRDKSNDMLSVRMDRIDSRLDRIEDRLMYGAPTAAADNEG